VVCDLTKVRRAGQHHDDRHRQHEHQTEPPARSLGFRLD
jgi:hypothetical protein